MTTLCSRTVICKNCGSPVQTTVYMSTNEFGSPDLDLRPAPMKRDLVHYLIQYCPECGYTGTDIREDPPVKTDFENLLKKSLTIRLNKPAVEELYERAAQIESLRTPSDKETASSLFLQAAWVADDVQRNAFAIEMRKQALFLKLQIKPYTSDRILQMIDIARRAEEFEKAEELLSVFPETETRDIYRKIVVFQQGLIRKKDSGCYQVRDVL